MSHKNDEIAQLLQRCEELQEQAAEMKKKADDITAKVKKVLRDQVPARPKKR